MTISNGDARAQRLNGSNLTLYAKDVLHLEFISLYMQVKTLFEWNVFEVNQHQFMSAKLDIDIIVIITFQNQYLL